MPTVEDVQEFFRIYYAPNNAVLTLSGSFDPATAGPPTLGFLSVPLPEDVRQKLKVPLPRGGFTVKRLTRRGSGCKAVPHEPQTPRFCGDLRFRLSVRCGRVHRFSRYR